MSRVDKPIVRTTEMLGSVNMFRELLHRYRDEPVSEHMSNLLLLADEFATYVERSEREKLYLNDVRSIVHDGKY